MRARYLVMLADLAERLPRGGVYRVVVRHDDDCPRIADPPGECTCNPEIDPPMPTATTTIGRA